MTQRFDIVILGLTITSSWGNGHATTWRSLVRGLDPLGQRVLFLERDQHWYADNRDEPQPAGATTVVYRSVDELIDNFEVDVRQAALVIVGSYVPDGIRIGEWVTSVARGRTAFYDIDTPVTLANLETGSAAYLTPDLIRRYDGYFSFTGGPTLRFIESRYGSPMARALYCSVDPSTYKPVQVEEQWDLGYLGTYSADRQPALNELLLKPAAEWTDGRFAVAGPQYPETIEWPSNVKRTIHLSPREHAAFYGAQRFTLNITREAMKHSGYSPSVRLFEAGACQVPIVSDWWQGLDTIFAPDQEVLVAETAEDTLRYLRDLSDGTRRGIAAAARKRILAEHTPTTRAAQLLTYLKEMNDNISPDTSRRNGGRGKNAVGMEKRPSSERQRKATGNQTYSAAVGIEDAGNLHQPARTGH
jgi:spore maturation protein CgeB